MSTRVLTKNFDVENYADIGIYLRYGGYQALKKALKAMQPAEIQDEVRRSQLVGLGGAGFSTGTKWGFIPKGTDLPIYVVVNADEGEPGTFKDRYLMAKAPHQLIEGIIITAYAVGAHLAYIYIRGEYANEIRILEKALAEAREHGFSGKNILDSGFDLDLYVHPGAGAYVCGEETGLIESLEGKKGWPRIKPPYFPAAIGLLGCPTIVNNVETLSHVPHIIERGAEWFVGLSKSGMNGGTRLYGVSGKVEQPGLYELPAGTPLREIIYDHAGGVRGGKKLKAVVPGGLSAPMLTADEIDVTADFPSMMAAGTMAGSGGVIVMDEDTCMVDVLRVVTRFYHHESCGQCTPCREGTGWMARMVERLWRGEGVPGDLETLLDVARNMLGNSIGVMAKFAPHFWQPVLDATPCESSTICLLADAAAMPVVSCVVKFRDEFEQHIRDGKCGLVHGSE